MELKCLDKYSLANIIANKVNFEIKKDSLKNMVSFLKVLNLINEYKENGYDDIAKKIMYVVSRLKLFEEKKEKEIVKDILNNIYLILNLYHLINFYYFI